MARKKRDENPAGDDGANDPKRWVVCLNADGSEPDDVAGEIRPLVRLDDKGTAHVQFDGVDVLQAVDRWRHPSRDELKDYWARKAPSANGKAEPAAAPAPEAAPAPVEPAPVPDPAPGATAAPAQLSEDVVKLLEKLKTELAEARRKLRIYEGKDRQLADSLKRLKRLEAAEAEAKKDYDTAKKAAASAAAEHIKLEEELRTGQQQLPFDLGAPDPHGGANGTEAKPVEPPAEVAELLDPPAELPASIDPVNDPKAMNAPVGLLVNHGLGARYVKALEEAGLAHVGEIGKWTADPPEGKGKRLSDIKGFKGKGEGALIDALAEFWKAWRKAGEVTQRQMAEADGDRWEDITITSLDVPTKVIGAINEFKWDGKAVLDLGTLFDFLGAGNTFADIPGMTETRAKSLDGAIGKLMENRAKEGRPVIPPDHPAFGSPAEGDGTGDGAAGQDAEPDTELPPEE